MNELLQGLRDGLKPTPLLTVSRWADLNRHLTSESAAEAGRWKTSRTPYLEEIMDNLSPSSGIIDVCAVKGVQLGFTEAGLNVVGCFIDIGPCPIMYVMPTIDMSKAISKSRFDPMVDNSPSLQKRIKPSRSRDSNNTTLVKMFSGGLLIFSGANSASSLRSRPIKVLVLDEVDAYPLNVDDEGSPVVLAEKRTSTFGQKRKVYKLSTPTLDSVSVIQKTYEQSDQRKYHVPCPHCGHMQHLEFENLKWTKGKPETVLYYCISCAAGFEERYKTRIMSKEGGAKWIATAPEKSSKTKRGYHINSLYSPIGWLSWAEIAEQWEDAQGDVNKLRVFVNTILGKTWKEDGDSPPWENLYNRREPYAMNTIPDNSVVVITVGVDVQKDRLELEIVGWCRGKSSYSIDYRTITGDTSNSKTWDELAQIVNETWQRPDGVVLPVRLMAVDTGYNTQHAYAFCGRFDFTRVIPIKGSDTQQIMISSPRPTQVTSSGKKVGTVKVFHVGVSLIKSELYGFLKQEYSEEDGYPRGYCHFPEYEPHYFRGLTAEQLQVVKDKKGFTKYQWVKKYERNEPLDTRVYARAAAALIGIDRWQDQHWDNMEKSYKQPDKKQQPKKPRDDFWD